MDLWWAYSGALLVAAGSIASVIGRSQEMTTPVSKDEQVNGVKAGVRWENIGAVVNAIGALVIVVGTLGATISDQNSPSPVLAIILGLAFFAVSALILVLVSISRQRRLKQFIKNSASNPNEAENQLDSEN